MKRFVGMLNFLYNKKMISTCRNVKTREEFFFPNFLFLFFYFNFRHVSNTVCGLKFASTNKQFFSVPRKSS